MRTYIVGFSALVLFASVTLGQPVEQDHVIRLTVVDPQQNLAEAATLIRTMAEIRDINVDPVQRSVSLHTTPSKIAMAEWLLEHLTKPTADAKQEYRPVLSADDITRVFLVKREMPSELNEIAVIVRTIGGIPKLFVYPPSKALAVRGTEEQIVLSEWVINRLDQPTPPQDSGIHQLLLTGSEDEVLRMFYLSDTTSPARLNEMGVQIRTGTKCQRLFAYPRLRAIVMRCNASQVKAAEQMVKAMAN